MTIEEREIIKQKKIVKKDKTELKNKGGYSRIYPLEPSVLEKEPKQQENYDYLILCSKEVYGELTMGGGVNARKKIDEFEKTRRSSPFPQKK